MSETVKDDYSENIKSIEQDETFGPILRSFQKLNQNAINEMQDPSILLKKRETGLYDPREIEKYPHSPTAQKYMFAFEALCNGFECLYEYTCRRDKVESEEDCKILEVGFRAYAVGFILENVMVGQFPPPSNTMALLDQYLQFRLFDAFAEYFKLRLFIEEKNTKEKLMKNIVACEVLATKLELRDPSDDVKMILAEVYGVVASLYTVTDEHPRALDCFDRAIKVDETNTNAIYGAAFNISHIDPKRAEALLLEFLRRAPKCDKQYPHVLYHLSSVYFHGNKISKAVRFFEMAQKSEKERLPFLPEVDTAVKTMLMGIMALPLEKYCINPECHSDFKSDLDLKQCTRCRKVWYCGRECQRHDWAYHKKFCK